MQDSDRVLGTIRQREIEERAATAWPRAIEKVHQQSQEVTYQ